MCVESDYHEMLVLNIQTAKSPLRTHFTKPDPTSKSARDLALVLGRLGLPGSFADSIPQDCNDAEGCTGMALF